MGWGHRSRGRGKESRRGRRSWLRRGALALSLAVAGCLGTAWSVAAVINKADPASAYRLAPANGALMADYAELAFMLAPSKDGQSRPARLARRALLADPTAASALTVLGIQAQLNGDEEKARRIFAYSNAISRRELRPRIWAIEEAVSRGDIAGALRNYDIALRTSKQANNLLFPTLAVALSQPRIRSELLKILTTDPVWKKDFLPYIASSGIEPAGAIALFREGRRLGLTADGQMRADLVKALANKGKHEDAWAYYRTFRPDARRDRSRDPTFLKPPADRVLFDWLPSEENPTAATPAAEGRNGVLDFSLPSGTGGKIIGQLQLLPPGSYQLRGAGRGINQPSRSTPYWVLTCIDGRELGRVQVSNSDLNGGRFEGRFVVPGGCPVQELSLIIKPSDDPMGVTGQIARVELVPWP